MKIRKYLIRALMLLSFLALPGADIECEDDEFEFNWPSIDVHRSCCCGVTWVVEECGGGWWWSWW